MIPSARALLSFVDVATIVVRFDEEPLVVGVVVAVASPVGFVSSRIGVGCSASGPPAVTGSIQFTTLPFE